MLSRLLPQVLLSLTLLATACSQKDEPEPVPVFEGRWNYATTTKYDYNRAGTLLDTRTLVNNPSYLLIRGDSVTYFARLINLPFATALLQHRGDTVALSYGSPLIMVSKHTSTDLSIRHFKTAIQIDGTYTDTENNYTR